MLPGQIKMYLTKSIFSGIMIGISATAYLQCENSIVGAFLFSFGLLSILLSGSLLYTGFIGFIDFKNLQVETFRAFLILFGNLIGCTIAAALCVGNFSTFYLDKCAIPMYQMFTSSILCGIMMYLAVHFWRSTSKVILVILPIMIFILAGFNHCIANFFYMMISFPYYSSRGIIQFIISILGNTIGSLGIRMLITTKK